MLLCSPQGLKGTPHRCHLVLHDVVLWIASRLQGSDRCRGLWSGLLFLLREVTLDPKLWVDKTVPNHQELDISSPMKQSETENQKVWSIQFLIFIGTELNLFFSSVPLVSNSKQKNISKVSKLRIQFPKSFFSFPFLRLLSGRRCQYTSLRLNSRAHGSGHPRGRGWIWDSNESVSLENKQIFNLFFENFMKILVQEKYLHEDLWNRSQFVRTNIV